MDGSRNEAALPAVFVRDAPICDLNETELIDRRIVLGLRAQELQIQLHEVQTELNNCVRDMVLTSDEIRARGCDVTIIESALSRQVKSQYLKLIDDN